jgi:hypothetical protein
LLACTISRSPVSPLATNSPVGVGARFDAAHLQHHLQELRVVRPLERAQLDGGAGHRLLLVVDDSAAHGGPFAELQHEVLVDTAVDDGELFDVARRAVERGGDEGDAAGGDVLERKRPSASVTIGSARPSAENSTRLMSR